MNKNRQKGLILIELLASMAIFSIGVMTIFVLFVNVTKGAFFSLERTNSSFLSAEAMEAADSLAAGNKGDLTQGEYETGINSDNQWVLIPRAGLVGHFLLSKDAADYSGLGNHGTVNGLSFVTDRRGKRNAAGSFNGFNSYVRIEDSSSFEITGPLTISAWVSGTSVGQRHIAGKYHSGLEQGGYLLFKTDSEYVFKIAGPEGQDFLSAERDSLLWEQAVGVYDPGKPAIYLYVNGTLRASKETEISSINPVPDLDFLIGADESKANVWQGAIADVRVYERALTQNEISGLFSNYSDKYYRKLVVKGPDSGLVSYWNFNEGEMCLAQDSKASNHALLKRECDIWAQDRYGRENRAVSFDGLEDFAYVSDNDSLQLENKISLSFWIKFPGTVPETDQAILSKRAAFSDDYAFSLVYEADAKGYSFGVSKGNSEALISVRTEKTALAGQWQNITAVFNGAERKIYIDGNLIGNAEASSLANNGSDSDLYIGQQADGSNKLKGFIDDLRIYSHALSESEIMSLYLADFNYYTVPAS